MNTDTTMDYIEKVNFERYKLLIEIILRRCKIIDSRRYQNDTFCIIFDYNILNERADFIIKCSTSDFYFPNYQNAKDLKSAYISYCKSDPEKVEGCQFVFCCYLILKTDRKKLSHYEADIDKFAFEIGINSKELKDIKELVDNIDQKQNFQVKTPLTVAVLGNIFRLPLFEEVDSYKLESL